MKKLHAWELSRNQPILRSDVILQHEWPIEQCPPHIRVYFSGKMKSPCFDLFIHWLIKQITNTYRNNFSRSYENRSIFETAYCIFYFFRVHTIKTTNWVNPLNETTSIWNYSPEWFEATSIRIRVKKLLGFKNVWILVDRT